MCMCVFDNNGDADHESTHSFFGEQEGDFSLVLKSVSAEKRGNSRDASLDSVAADKFHMQGGQQQREESGRQADGGFKSWIGKLCGWKM